MSGSSAPSGSSSKSSARIEHQRPHEADALPLPAGKLHGIVIAQFGGEARQGGEFRESFVNAWAAPTEMTSHEGDIAACRQVGKESAILNHEADAPAQLARVMQC